jgi:hypothetical protein
MASRLHRHLHNVRVLVLGAVTMDAMHHATVAYAQGTAGQYHQNGQEGIFL